MNGQSKLIASIVTLFLVIGVPALSQESPPDLTGTWVSTYTGTCFDPIEGKTQESGQNWTIYIDDHGNGTFNAALSFSSETVYFGKITSHPKKPDKGAVVFTKCNINDSLTTYRSTMAWGEFDIKKEALNVTTVVYFTGSNQDIWEVCDYQDRYTRVSYEIPFAVPPCQP